MLGNVSCGCGKDVIRTKLLSCKGWLKGIELFLSCGLSCFCPELLCYSEWVSQGKKGSICVSDALILHGAYCLWRSSSHPQSSRCSYLDWCSVSRSCCTSLWRQGYDLELLYSRLRYIIGQQLGSDGSAVKLVRQCIGSAVIPSLLIWLGCTCESI